MYLGQPLSYRSEAGLLTIGFLLCETGDVIRRVFSVEYVEIVSGAMIEACCGKEFAAIVRQAIDDLVAQTLKEGKLDLDSDALPSPFVPMRPALSAMPDRERAIESITMMIADLGFFREARTSISSMSASGRVCGMESNQQQREPA